MTSLHSNSEPTLCAESKTPGIMIIYEDRTTGFQAKRFSDKLAASLGCLGQVIPTCWRSELLDLPGVADEMKGDANRSEFVILALRGDCGLSVEMKAWIESWLASAAGGPAVLIALFDPARITARHAESVRCYLRHVSSGAVIPFFSHCSVTPANATEKLSALDEEVEVLAPLGRPRPRRSRKGFSRTPAAA